MTSTDSNRREWFRIDNRVALVYDVLSEIEMQARMKDARAGGFPPGGLTASLFSMESELQVKLAKARDHAPNAAAAIELLNNKLNALINLLPLLGEDHDLLTQPPVESNLSASGLAFASTEKLDPDTSLYLRLMLAPDYYYVETYARVVRCDPIEGDPEHPFRVAVHFELIADEQRELLIRHTRAKETELLRARRLERA